MPRARRERRAARSFALQVQILILGRDGGVPLGPGQSALLDAINRTGSIRAAAADLKMSYTRAWILVRTMNEVFPTPLVEKSRGGARRGGAILTTRGSHVLELYRRMQRQAERALISLWERLRTEL